MRVVASIGFAAALVSGSAGAILAAPPPFLLLQRAAAPSIGLPLSGTPPGKDPQVATGGVPYSFGSGADGRRPWAGLLYVNGSIYGTTQLGGKYGEGTVFAVTPAGSERVVYSFRHGPDGAQPLAGLIDVNDVLYGTTYSGGTHGEGTVFAVTSAGTERVLHNFDAQNSFDGAQPLAGLIDVNGVLYGTTSAGGYGWGTVFTITTAGTERVLYAFHGGDGWAPYGGLTDVGGVLYGTTSLGGKYPGATGWGAGTVFAVTPNGSEHVVHSFDGTDGEQPMSGVIEVSGTLYGTTRWGGRYGTGSLGAYGDGTVFAVTPAGIGRVLHNFGSGTDGEVPWTGLTDVNGTLYGTTAYGGKYGDGTVFAITTAGSERLLRNFRTCHNPGAPLIDVNGVLYGTTYGGGNDHLGGAFFFQLP